MKQYLIAQSSGVCRSCNKSHPLSNLGKLPAIIHLTLLILTRGLWTWDSGFYCSSCRRGFIAFVSGIVLLVLAGAAYFYLG